MHESEKWKWSRSVVSDSSQPHGLQPTRLLRPWDFPGKSTGVGCHCLLRNRHEWASILVILFHLSNSPCPKHTSIMNDRFVINLDISEAKPSYFCISSGVSQLSMALYIHAESDTTERLLFTSLQCWSFSRVRLFVTPWIVALQAPLSMGFSRQEYWSGLPFPSPPTTDICTFAYLNVDFENRKYILMVKKFKCTWWHMLRCVPHTPFVKFYEKYYWNFDYNSIGFRDLRRIGPFVILSPALHEKVKSSV